MAAEDLDVGGGHGGRGGGELVEVDGVLLPPPSRRQSRVLLDVVVAPARFLQHPVALEVRLRR